MNRRNFFGKISFLAAIVTGWKTVGEAVGFGLSEPVELEIRCNFPKEMSFEEFNLHQRQMVDLDSIVKLDTEFLESKQILETRSTFGGRDMSWTYRFANEAAFNNWDSRRKAITPLNMAYYKGQFHFTSKLTNTVSQSSRSIPVTV